MTGAPSRTPAPRQDSRNPVCSLPPSRWTPNGMSTALSDALAARKMTVTGSSARATGWRRRTRTPSIRSRATSPIAASGPRCPLSGPGRQEHGDGGQQVAEGVRADQPPDAADGQQDPAERAADQLDRAAGDRGERIGAAQHRPGADDGRCASLQGRRVKHGAAALGDSAA